MVKLVLIDLSGTLHIGNQAITGAIEALNKLRNANVKLKFVTNTTKESRRMLHNRLTQIGFTVQPEEIHSSLGAAVSLIKTLNFKPMLLVAPEAMEDFVEVNRADIPDAVVIGLAPTEFHYEKLNEAFRCLLNGAHLIGIHAGKYYKREDGLALGPGLFVKGLEYAAQCSATLVGKPNPSFFKSALDDISPSDAVMIGDDATDDIQGALRCGIRSFLVKTGKYRSGDEDKITPRPTAIYPSIVEAVERIIEECGN